MAAETAAARPRRSLLIALGVAVAALIAYWQWPAASPAAGPSNPAGGPRAAQTGGVSPASLKVRMAELQTPPPAPARVDRNPFRFKPQAPPTPPAAGPGREGSPQVPTRAAPPQPVGPPPIPLKFIGILEARGPGRVAILSDGHGPPVYGHEGDTILGQYRIVHIGVESIVMEYLDGTGRRTIPLTGQ
jgi:hypothetical protein